MVIAFATGVASIAVGATVNIAGLPFVNTPAGLIGETPLTCEQLATLETIPILGDGYTLATCREGMIAMHSTTGNVYVLARGRSTEEGGLRFFTSPVSLEGETLTTGPRGSSATLQQCLCRPIMPPRLRYIDPERASFPVTKINWYHGAAIAAALTQLQPDYLVRMITDAEFDRVVLSDGAEQESDVVARARLLHQGISAKGGQGPAPVVDEAAQARKSPWGLIDVFGNGQILTNTVFDPEDVHSGKPMDAVSRVTRNIPWYVSSGFMSVRTRLSTTPTSPDGGVRFVAVPRTLR